MKSVPISEKSDIACLAKQVPSLLLLFPSSLSHLSLKTAPQITRFYVLWRKAKEETLKAWFAWISRYNILWL